MAQGPGDLSRTPFPVGTGGTRYPYPGLRPRMVQFSGRGPFQGSLTAPGSLGNSVSTSRAFSRVPTWPGTAPRQQYPPTPSPLSALLESLDSSTLTPAAVDVSSFNPQPTLSPRITSPPPPPPPPPPPRSEQTDLLTAASSGSVDVVRALIEDGVHINQTDEHGWTALHLASQEGSTCMSVVKVLLQKGADISIRDEDGHTPLMIASFHGHVDVVGVLIEEGHAHVNAQNMNGWTPLMAASQEGHVDVVRVLIEEGHAHVDTQNMDGWTPLMAASQEGHVDVIRVLIEEGHAHVNAQNKEINVHV